MAEFDIEAASELQDILEEVLNGRPDGHRCPKCGKGTLIAKVEEDVKVRLECPDCRTFFEWRM
ncbi:MAG: hypothetical protein IV100_26800 [Myxococcales bacterium]|jgi:ribosomal protein S27AE|nr:hypothetical protein [Myxococcales bacterium]